MQPDHAFTYLTRTHTYTPIHTHMQLLIKQQVPAVASTPDLPQLQPLIQSCLQLNPAARPTAQAVAKVGRIWFPQLNTLGQ